jgi:hypothetical protein
VGRIAVEHPDNLTWARDGRLLVTGQNTRMADMLRCGEVEGSCGVSFQVLAVDTETFEAELLLEHAGAPMGAGTVALEVGPELVIGSFRGDRVVHLSPAY